MPVVCQFPLSLSECPDWPLEAEREPAERGNFSKCTLQTQCHFSHTGLLPTCRCVESLPASQRSLRTVSPADGSQSNHSVQRAGPAPPCTQDCCIYWSLRMMTSFPASQRGCCQNVPGSMSAPRAWQKKKGVNTYTPNGSQCDPVFKQRGMTLERGRWQSVPPFLEAGRVTLFFGEQANCFVWDYIQYLKVLTITKG